MSSQAASDGDPMPVTLSLVGNIDRNLPSAQTLARAELGVRAALASYVVALKEYERVEDDMKTQDLDELLFSWEEDQGRLELQVLSRFFMEAVRSAENSKAKVASGNSSVQQSQSLDRGEHRSQLRWVGTTEEPEWQWEPDVQTAIFMPDFTSRDVAQVRAAWGWNATANWRFGKDDEKLHSLLGWIKGTLETSKSDSFDLAARADEDDDDQRGDIVLYTFSSKRTPFETGRLGRLIPQTLTTQ